VDGIGRRVETTLLDGVLAYLGIKWADVDIGVAPADPGSIRLVCRPFVCAGDGDPTLAFTQARSAGSNSLGTVVMLRCRPRPRPRLCGPARRRR
jgi:hypothetical protein